MIALNFDGRSVPVKVFKFPGGEIQVRLPETEKPSNALIFAQLRSSDDIMELLLTADAVERVHAGSVMTIDLVCPYLPYARQDRVCHPGEALAALLFWRVLSTVNFHSVTVWDVHNPDVFAYVGGIVNIPASQFITGIGPTKAIVVAPDDGAVERAMGCAKALNTDCMFARKTRNPDTGEITGTTVGCGYVGGRDFLIVDDICDGGRTFIELAKVLQVLTTGKILLYVTHGIFSQGFDVFNGLIDRIYTPNPFPTELPPLVVKLP